MSENKAVKDTVIRPDTLRTPEQLQAVVYSKADRIRNDIPKKMTYLNTNAQVKYQDMQIDADYISIDWNKSLVFARGELDSLGRISKPAVALQGGKTYEYDEFTYNIKTRQAIAFNARTEESSHSSACTTAG